MLKKNDRLPVGAQSRPRASFRSDHFTLKVFPGVFSRSRFGIALGKVTAESAVKRNALKRVFFNFAERVREDLPRHDFLIVAGKGSGELSKEQQQEELKKLFAQIEKSN